jgi:hypothetical protein
LEEVLGMKGHYVVNIKQRILKIENEATKNGF